MHNTNGDVALIKITLFFIKNTLNKNSEAQKKTN